MTIRRAMIYIRYSLECPEDVSALRWAGILKYFKTHGEID